MYINLKNQMFGELIINNNNNNNNNTMDYIMEHTISKFLSSWKYFKGDKIVI